MRPLRSTIRKDSTCHLASLLAICGIASTSIRCRSQENDRFAAYADAGGLVMGHYANSTLPLWGVARRFTLADNFFMGAFGGSFLNHFTLVCACAPTYPNADQGPAKRLISAVEADDMTLKPAVDMPKSALDGPPKF